MNTLRTDGTLLGSPTYCVGVELDALRIRAAVVDSAGRLLGKSKCSTKLDRGPEAVVARVARCVEDAADECDLSMRQCAGVGVAIPGRVDVVGNRVAAASALGWRDVLLREPLEAMLGKPVRLGNREQLATLAIHAVELSGKPAVFAAVFCGVDITGGLLVHGQSPGPQRLAEFLDIIEEGRTSLALATLGAARPDFPPHKLRKAVRRGHAAATAYALEVARHAGRVIARVVESCKPETIALAGDVLEELRPEMTAVVQETASGCLGMELDRAVGWWTSCLGDAAPLVGAGVFAARAGQAVAAVLPTAGRNSGRPASF